MGSFLSGIFDGAAPGLDSAQQTASGMAGFGTGVGEGAVQSGLGFQEDLLSGNQAKEAQLLAPEIGNIQKQGQQQIQTAGEFGNRSGGVNAAAQNNIDTQRSSVNDMVAKLTGNAANSVASTGEGLLGIGLSASEAQAREAQQKLENEKNSIFGQGVSSGLGSLEGFGLGTAEHAMNPGVFDTMAG